MNSPLLDKSLDFATQIVLFYEEFSKTKKDTTIANQLLALPQVLVQISTKPYTETVKPILYPSYISRLKKQAKAFIG